MFQDYFRANDFTEFWTVFNARVGAIGILLIITQLIYLTIQLNRARGQVKMLQNSETTKIFFEIMDRWQTVYEARNRILAKPAVTLDDLVKKYGDDPSELLASKDWLQNYRPVLNFFEFLGVILSNDVFDQKSITAHMLTLVTVDAFSAEGDVDEQTLIASGTIYAHLRPYLDYLRSHTQYRADIYEFYDAVLLQKYAAHIIEKRSATKAG